MKDTETALLKKIYVSNVLMLAAQLKREKKEKGTTSTSDFINDAIKLIEKNSHRILLSR